eukprot:gene11620-11764_t
MQVLVLIAGLGWLHPDLAHTVVVPIKVLLGLGLMLPLPYISITALCSRGRYKSVNGEVEPSSTSDASGAPGQAASASWGPRGHSPAPTSKQTAVAAPASVLHALPCISDGFLKDISGSLQLAAAASTPNLEGVAAGSFTHSFPDCFQTASPTLGPAGGHCKLLADPPGAPPLPDILPTLRRLLGAEEAAAVYSAAAASAHAGAERGPALLKYTPLTTQLPVSVKLLATVFQLKSRLPGGNTSAAAAAAAAPTPPSPPSLLLKIQNSDVTNQSRQYRVAQQVDHEAVAETGGPAAGQAQDHPIQLQAFASQLLEGVQQQLHQAPVTAAGVEFSGVSAADAYARAAAGQIDIFVSGVTCSGGGEGKEQQQLGLTVRALGNSSSAHCRLLLLQGGDVVFEVPDVVMQQATHGTFSTSVRLPPLPVGVVQLALLGRTSTEAEGSRPGSSGGPPPAAVPLLLQPLLVLPEDAATELEALFQSSAAEAAVAALSAGQDSNTAIAEAAAGAWAVLSSFTVDLAYVLSAAQQLSSSKEATVEGSSGGDGGSEGVLPGDVRSVLTHLLTHLAGWHCWNMLNFTVQHLASLAAAGGAQAAPMAADETRPATGAKVDSAAGLEVDAAAALSQTKSLNVTTAPELQNVNVTAELTSTAAVTDKPFDDSSDININMSIRTGKPNPDKPNSEEHSRERSPAVPPSTAATQFAEYEPDAKPSALLAPCCEGGRLSSLGASSGGGAVASLHFGEAGLGCTKTPAGVAAAVLTSAAAAERQRLIQQPSWRAAGCQLVWGFDSASLELSYLDYMANQTYCADLFSAVYGLGVGLSANLITDGLRASVSNALAVGRGDQHYWELWLLAAWEIASRFWNFVVLVVPNLVLLLYRHRLTVGGRREAGIRLCEAALASMPLATALGLMRVNSSALDTLCSRAMMVTGMVWASGVLKAACRQVRLRSLLPTLLVELVGAVGLSVRFGLSLRFSVARYLGTTVSAVVTAGLLELCSRKSYLERLTQA